MRLVTFLRWSLLLVSCLLAQVASSAAEEPIAIIMSANAPSVVLKKDDLILLYQRKKLFWPDGVRAQPVNLPANHPLRQAFSQAVLNRSPEDLEKYWNDLYFHGISPPYVLASEEAILRFVSETPGAIGYVPLCSVDTRVKIVLVISINKFSEKVPTTECKH